MKPILINQIARDLQEVLVWFGVPRERIGIVLKEPSFEKVSCHHYSRVHSATVMIDNDFELYIESDIKIQGIRFYYRSADTQGYIQSLGIVEEDVTGERFIEQLTKFVRSVQTNTVKLNSSEDISIGNKLCGIIDKVIVSLQYTNDGHNPPVM